ncbi:MAG: thiocillin family RiPP [Ardenticatenales bacterium]|nr:thiocillin family RiPP [Ardenticatenales bacterium]
MTYQEQIHELEDMDLFADELDERYNAGAVSSGSCSSSASSATSCASCACTFSCLCSADVAS